MLPSGSFVTFNHGVEMSKILFYVLRGIAIDVAILIVLGKMTGNQNRMTYDQYLEKYGSVADSHPEAYSNVYYSNLGLSWHENCGPLEILLWLREKRRGAFETDERYGGRPFSKRQFRRERGLVVLEHYFTEPVETVSKASFAQRVSKSSNQETERHHVSHRHQSAEEKSFYNDKNGKRTAAVRFGTKSTERNPPHSSFTRNQRHLDKK